MCPICLTTTVLIAGGVTFTGGLTAIAIKKLGMKHAIAGPVPTPTEEDHHG